MPLRPLLAAAFLALAVTPAGAAHAGPESCAYVTYAPRFVYYEPEGGLFVSYGEAQAWASSQPGSASAYAGCVAGSVRPDGCLGDYLTAGYPSESELVTIDGEGRVIVDPNDPFLAAVVGNAAAFVDCVV